MYTALFFLFVIGSSFIIVGRKTQCRIDSFSLIISLDQSIDCGFCPGGILLAAVVLFRRLRHRQRWGEQDHVGHHGMVGEVLGLDHLGTAHA